MSVTLTNGLSDLSLELGESSTVSTAARIKQYGDAVVEFFNEKKWPFATKLNNSITTQAGIQSYSLSAITDRRMPGWIKEVCIGSGDALTPILFEERNDPKWANYDCFYIDEENDRIIFTNTISTGGDAINIRYHYIPARTTDTTSGTYPLPDRYRKAVSLLAAAFVQWSRYLDAQGNAKWNLYQKEVGNISGQQEERHKGQQRRIPHPLAYRGFRRTYPK